MQQLKDGQVLGLTEDPDDQAVRDAMAQLKGGSIDEVRVGKIPREGDVVQLNGLLYKTTRVLSGGRLTLRLLVEPPNGGGE